MKEAEEYDGPSVVLANTPCIEWGLTSDSQVMEIQKIAVDSGYWPLYRYDPRKSGNKFQLDSKKIKVPVEKYLDMQLRFTRLKVNDKELSD